MMLGRDKYVVLALCLAGIIFLNSSARRNWRLIVGYLAVFAISYLIPAMARMGNPFFGTNADVLMLLGGVVILAALLTKARLQHSTTMRGTAWAMIALTLFVFQWPPAHYNRGSEWSQTVNRLGQELYQTIRDYPGSHNARVFFTAPGAVDDMLFRYNSLADGRTFWCPNRHMSDDLAVFRKEIGAADFVVASEANSKVAYDQMIKPNVQGDALQISRDDSGLAELAHFPALNGKYFYVFVRRDLTANSAVEKPVPFEEPWSPLYSGE
jgi:hypothetical protein